MEHLEWRNIHGLYTTDTSLRITVTSFRTNLESFRPNFTVVSLVHPKFFHTI